MQLGIVQAPRDGELEAAGVGSKRAVEASSRVGRICGLRDPRNRRSLGLRWRRRGGHVICGNPRLHRSVHLRATWLRARCRRGRPPAPPRRVVPLAAFGYARHSGQAAPATRRQRLAIVRSFLGWLVGEGRLSANPTVNIRPPKRRHVEQRGQSFQDIERLIAAQPRSSAIRSA